MPVRPDNLPNYLPLPRNKKSLLAEPFSSLEPPYPPIPMFYLLLQFARNHPCACGSLLHRQLKLPKKAFCTLGSSLVALTLTDGSNSILKCQDWGSLLWRDCVRLSNFGICGYPLWQSPLPPPAICWQCWFNVQFPNPGSLHVSPHGPNCLFVCTSSLPPTPPPQYLSSQLQYLPQKFPFPLTPCPAI